MFDRSQWRGGVLQVGGEGLSLLVEESNLSMGFFGNVNALGLASCRCAIGTEVPTTHMIIHALEP